VGFSFFICATVVFLWEVLIYWLFMKLEKCIDEVVDELKNVIESGGIPGFLKWLKENTFA